MRAEYCASPTSPVSEIGKQRTGCASPSKKKRTFFSHTQEYFLYTTTFNTLQNSQTIHNVIEHRTLC